MAVPDVLAFSAGIEVHLVPVLGRAELVRHALAVGSTGTDAFAVTPEAAA